MAINLNDLANALTGAQEQPAAPRASRDQYGTIALDAYGTPTVMLDGGEDYAPCTCMVGVHHGDRVLAHVVNHKIVVFANITAPTTDDAQALVAIDRADAAAEAADAAGIAAASAQGSADDAAAAARAADAKAAAAGSAAAAAQTSADNAATAAANAQTSADNAATAAATADAKAVQAAIAAATADAKAVAAGAAASAAQADATRANTAANSALIQASIVEDVAGTIRWIQEHGTYVATTDTTVQDGTVYFELKDGDYVPIVNPTGNPQAQGWYVLDITDAQSDFIMSHFAVTGRGLWVLPSGKGSASDEQHAAGYKMLLASDGMYLYDSAGALVTTYGESITFDSDRPQRIGNDTAYVEYYDSDNDGIPDSIRISGTNLNAEIANFRQTVSETYATKDEAKQTGSDSGKREIVTEDAAELPLLTLTAYGECEQDGTPTPDAPVPIKAVRSRNLLNFQSASQYTVNSDGTITLNSAGSFNIKFDALPEGKYWLYARIVSGSASGTSLFTIAGITYYQGDLGTSKQFINAIAPSQIWVSGNANFTVGTTVEIMLTAKQCTAFAPYGCIAAVSHGKNHVNCSKFTTNYAKSPVTPTESGYSVTYGNSWGGNIAILGQRFAAGSYILSFDIEASTSSNVRLLFDTDVVSVNGAAVVGSGSWYTDRGFPYSNHGDATGLATIVASNEFSIAFSFAPGVTNAVDSLANIQLERGTEATDYEPYRESVSYIDLNGEELCSLPDGTEDVLTVDASGHVEIEKLVAYTDAATTDGVSAIVGTDAWSTTGDLSDGADVYYPLAEPRTIDLGYIELPTTFPNGTVHAEAEIQPVIDASWWTAAGYDAGKAYNDGSADLAALTERVTTAESSITQQAGQIALKANAADVNTKAETTALLEVKANKATLTSEINASADTVKIDAGRVNIEGAAIFTGSGRLSQSSLDGAYDASGAAGGAVNALKTDLASASGTTVIDGGHISTNSLTVGHVSGLQGTLDGKASTASVANAAKRTYVSIRATAIDYAADTATLEATLYIDGTATTTGVTYAWLVDGTAISGATARTYSVPASSGLDHAYSCKATW